MMTFNEHNDTPGPEESTTPRWVGLAIAALGIVSLIALASGWTASSHARSLEQSLGIQNQGFRQNQDTLTTQLAKAEQENAEIRAELKTITDKLKLTEGDVRAQTKKVGDQDAKSLTEMKNEVNGQLATKASLDDLNKLGGDVSGVKTDLEATKNSLQMTRSEYGTLIARDHDQIEELRRHGERDYYEFTVTKKGARQKVGEMMVELRGTNPKKNLYTVTLYVDDQRYEKSNRSTNEPIFFFTAGSRTPLEFVVNQVSKDKIVGYLSVPKVSTQPATASSGS